MRLFAGTPFDRPPKCDRCGALESECKCPPLPVPQTPPGEQTLQLAIEKRKKGKVVTLVRGLQTTGDQRADLLTELKNACGAGGTFQEEQLELQGNHLERARQVLSKLGYRVKA